MTAESRTTEPREPREPAARAIDAPIEDDEPTTEPVGPSRDQATIASVRDERRTLRDERRNDHQAEEDEDHDDGEVDDENGEPAGHAAHALEDADDRREPHGDERADVDEEQRFTRRPQDREQDDGPRDGRDGLQQSSREVAIGRRRRGACHG